MKNIHILRTDKPSRLFINSLWEHQLRFVKDRFIEKNKERLPHNMHITSDEKVKNGDWCLDKFNQKWKLIDGKLAGFDDNGIQRFSTDNVSGHKLKKIILTTDDDLIKENIQAIDDEFLEWFVKNSACQFAHLGFTSIIGDSGTKRVYKIIIPKEASKTNLEKLQFPELVKEFAEYYKNTQLVEESKQEIIEEAALKHADLKLIDSDERYYQTHKCDKYDAFKAGAKWQSERIQALRNDLYNQLPKGDVSAFDLIKIISNHIKRLDEI